MTPLKSSEVIEYVDALMHETQQVRDDAEHFEKVHGLYHLPKLPADLARDEAVYVLSPDVMHEARETKARVMTFETEIQCMPTARTAGGTVGENDKRAADEIERAGAIFLSRLDPDLRLKAAITDRQMVEPLAIVVLELGAIDTPDPRKRFPWRAFEVELDGCGWLEESGVPTVFGRKYSQLVSSVQRQYSRRKDGPQGPTASLTWDDGKKAFDWKNLSDDFTDRTGIMSSSSKGFERCDMVWLDDGETIYHVALQGTGDSAVKRQGEVLWSGPNTFGRVSAFLIGSNVRPARTMRDRYLPFYLDMIMTSEVENVVESIRATASRNRANARQYWNADPEVLKTWLQQNGGTMPPGTVWRPGETPVAMGTLESETIEVDPDLDKLDARIQERKALYRSNANNLSDPNVLKNATLGAQLAAWDASAASLSIVLGPQDTFQKQLLQAWENSIRWIAKTHGNSYAQFDLQATGSETVSGGKKLSTGDAVSLTVDSFSVEHEWRVETSQHTRGQAQAEYGAAMERFALTPDGRPGIGVYEDLLKAAGVSDVNERKVTLLKESVRFEKVDPLTDQWIEKALAYQIELETGIPADFLLGVPPTAPEANAPPPDGGTVTTGQSTASPVTAPATGGSGPALVGG